MTLMNRWYVAISAVAFALLLATTGGAQQTSDDLRGVWKLTRLTEGGKDVPMNAFMFLSKTYYSRVTVEKDRPKFPKGFDFRKPETLTPEQQHTVALLFPRSNSNGGTYHVEGNTFFFTALAHQNPNAEGVEFRRRMELHGNTLRLVQEADRGADETWLRVEDFR